MLTRAQQKLVTDNMGIAIRVLTKLNVRRGPGYDDCRSEAMLALVKAAASFDPSRAGFSTWAWLKCTGAVKDHMDREARQRLRPSKPIDELERAFDEPDVEHMRPARARVAARLCHTAPLPDEQAYDSQVVEMVHAVLLDAPAVVKDTAERILFEGMSTPACAAVQGVSTITAARRRRDAREHLTALKNDLDLMRAEERDPRCAALR